MSRALKLGTCLLVATLFGCPAPDGPRYMGAALPFWSLGVLFAWQASGDRIWRASLVVLTLWGIGCSLVAVSTTVQPPERYERPMSELLWPAFVEGDLSLNHQSFLEYRAEPARLRGGSSLVCPACQ